MSKLDVIKKYIYDASQDLVISTPKLAFAKESDIENKDETAYYLAHDNTIYFNEDWVKKTDLNEVILTAYIQLRYAYQYFEILNSETETYETIQIWYQEKIKDQAPDIVFDDEMDVAYIKLNYVIDAIAYGHFMLLEKHDLLSVIPDEVKSSVLDRVEELKKRANQKIS